MTQTRLAELMTHLGIPWTVFTVSDAELALKRGDKGRRFTPDELALLALVFYVTPAALLVPPRPEEVVEDMPVVRWVRVGSLVMSREAYLTDVLLHASGIGARGTDGGVLESTGGGT